MMAAPASSSSVSSSAVRALALEFKSLQEEPLEGIRSRLVTEENLFEWEVALFGPPETLYQGGYFKVTFFHSATPTTSLLWTARAYLQILFC